MATRTSKKPRPSAPKGSARVTPWPPEKPASKAKRIRCLVEAMTGGMWVTGVTAHQLAAAWGMSPKTLEADASEASRIVREAVATDDEIRARVLGTLETITQQAMKRGQLRSAIEAVRVLAGVRGLEAPTQLEVDGVAGLLQLAQKAEES